MVSCTWPLTNHPSLPGASWSSMAVPRPSKEPGRPGSCLPGLGLDAVIDGTQTGTGVDFNISEPPQQGAGQRVDRLIGDRRFIPVPNGGPPPLCLLGLAPAHFLDVRDSGGAHLETFVKVRVWDSRPGVTQLGDATLEHVVRAGLSVGHQGQTGLPLGGPRGCAPRVYR